MHFISCMTLNMLFNIALLQNLLFSLSFTFSHCLICKVGYYVPFSSLNASIKPHIYITAILMGKKSNINLTLVESPFPLCPKFRKGKESHTSNFCKKKNDNSNCCSVTVLWIHRAQAYIASSLDLCALCCQLKIRRLSYND